MSIILLIRSADDMLSAIASANQFLLCRRRAFADSRQGGEVLGIWLKGNLDEGLPPLYFGDEAPQPGDRSDSLTGETDLGPGLVEAPVGLEWSFTHGGLWSLCWLDGALLREANGSKERRRRILDALWSPAFGARSSRKPGLFFPVFGAADAVGSIDATMRELRRCYPRLISGTWLVDDSEQGIVNLHAVEV